MRCNPKSHQFTDILFIFTWGKGVWGRGWLGAAGVGQDKQCDGRGPGLLPKGSRRVGRGLVLVTGCLRVRGRQHPENFKVSVAQESTAVQAPLSL